MCENWYYNRHLSLHWLTTWSRQVARPVQQSMYGTKELKELVTLMMETMRDAPGVGLAAPQIGIPLRVRRKPDGSSRALALLSCAESVARRACATGDSFGGQSGVHRALLARACSGDAAGSLPCVRCLQPLPKGLSPRRTEQGSVTAFPSPLVHSCSRGVRCSWRAPRLCAACGLRRRAVLRGLFEHPGLPGARPAALRTRSMPGGTSACRPKPAHALRITITCAEGVQRLREQQRAARAGRVARVRALKRCAQAMVGRYLSVECSGYKPDGTPLRFKASGWQARILQHEVRGPRPPLIAANVLGRGSWRKTPLAAKCLAAGPLDWLVHPAAQRVLLARHTACTAARQLSGPLTAAPRAGLLCNEPQDTCSAFVLVHVHFSVPACSELHTLGAARGRHAFCSSSSAWLAGMAEQCSAVPRHIPGCASSPAAAGVRALCSAGAQVDCLQGRCSWSLGSALGRR